MLNFIKALLYLIQIEKQSPHQMIRNPGKGYDACSATQLASPFLDRWRAAKNSLSSIELSTVMNGVEIRYSRYAVLMSHQ
jgi:hypothetical protein